MRKIGILWADDEIDLLKPHILLLEQKGYEVETALSGDEAIQMVDESDYDVIFLDENMPGLTGLEALAEIKRNKPSIPIVMITKSEEEYLMDDAIGSQITDYLIKPVSQIVLNAKLVAMHRISEMQNELINLSNKLSETNKKLENSVITDPLTGAKNRLYLDECIKREWYRGISSPIALNKKPRVPSGLESKTMSWLLTSTRRYARLE